MFPESQFVFDVELPLDFKPRVGDGEVQDFYLLPIEKVSVAAIFIVFICEVTISFKDR